MTSVGNGRRKLLFGTVVLAGAVLAAIACNDAAVTGPGFVCDVTNPVSDVRFDSLSQVVFVHSPARSADTSVVTAKAINRVGAVRTDVPITFSSSDTTIATVDDHGVVHALKPGTVRIKASTCGKSASADITIALLATSVEVKFDAVSIVGGDSVLVRARAHPQGSTESIPGAKFTFSVSAVPGVSVVQRTDSTAMVKTAGTSAGAALVTAVGEGATGSGSLTIIQRVVDAKLDTTLVVAGDSVLVRGRAHALGSTTSIAGQVFTFASTPPAGITVTQKTDSTAFIKTSAAGTFSITATNLGVVGTTSLSVLPRTFVGSLAGNETGIDAGRDFGCGLIPLGRLYCWGLNASFQLGAATDSVCFEEGVAGASPCRLIPIRVAAQLAFSSVSAGDDFACGLIGTGKAYCWGSGTSGKIGNGGTAGASAPTPITFGSFFTSISAGGNHACAIGTNGTAYCWGQDDFGQLGDARLVNSTTPIPVVAGGGVPTFSSISAGLRHTCALDAAGSATCWGLNNNGQLGAGLPGGFSDQPQPVAGGISFKAISAGGDTVLAPIFRFESHTCGIATNGAAFCWGSNGSGQLGNGSVGGPDVNVPTPVAGGLSFAKISAGSRFTCGLTTGGAIYCWGHNADLQLGRGPFTGGGADSGVPQIVSGGELPAGVTFVSVTAGRRHACGVGSDGAAYCWGSDVFGALGNTFQAAFRGLPQRVATPQ